MTNEEIREEIARLSQRIQIALDRRPMMPFQSLQYRLTEVGRSRSHPIKLRAAVRLLSSPPRQRSRGGDPGHPWEPLRDLFVSPELTSRAALSLSKSREYIIRQLHDVNWYSAMKPVVRAIEKEIPGLHRLESEAPKPSSMVIAGELAFGGFSATFEIEHRGRLIRVWVTEEAGWLSPNDPRLWAFLAASYSSQARSLIIARKIDPTAFVVFKALGVRGLQYYNVWAPDRAASQTAQIAEELGWFNVKPSGTVRSHELFGQLPGAVEFLARSDTSTDAGAAIDLAIQLRLSESLTPRSHGLLRWAEQSGTMPERWVGTIREWERWEQLDSSVVLQDVPAVQQRPKPKPSKAALSQHEEELTPPRKTTVSRVPIRLT